MIDAYLKTGLIFSLFITYRSIRILKGEAWIVAGESKAQYFPLVMSILIVGLIAAVLWPIFPFLCHRRFFSGA